MEATLQSTSLIEPSAKVRKLSIVEARSDMDCGLEPTAKPDDQSSEECPVMSDSTIGDIQQKLDENNSVEKLNHSVLDYGESRRSSKSTDDRRVRKFICRYCNKAFSLMNVLKVHERIHTGEKPYVCEICDKAFNQSGSLNRHKNTHMKRSSDNRSYSCRYCSRQFLHASQLQEHEHLEHGITSGIKTSPQLLDVLHSSPYEQTTKASQLNSLTGSPIEELHESLRDTTLASYREIAQNSFSNVPLENNNMVSQPFYSNLLANVKVAATDAKLDSNRRISERVRSNGSVPASTYTCGICPQAFKSQVDLNAHSAQHILQQLGLTTSQSSSAPPFGNYEIQDTSLTHGGKSVGVKSSLDGMLADVINNTMKPSPFNNFAPPPLQQGQHIDTSPHTTTQGTTNQFPTSDLFPGAATVAAATAAALSHILLNPPSQSLLTNAPALIALALANQGFLQHQGGQATVTHPLLGQQPTSDTVINTTTDPNRNICTVGGASFSRSLTTQKNQVAQHGHNISKKEEAKSNNGALHNGAARNPINSSGAATLPPPWYGIQDLINKHLNNQNPTQYNNGLPESISLREGIIDTLLPPSNPNASGNRESGSSINANRSLKNGLDNMSKLSELRENRTNFSPMQYGKCKVTASIHNEIDDMPYICRYCDRRFFSMKSLERHTELCRPGCGKSRENDEENGQELPDDTGHSMRSLHTLATESNREVLSNSTKRTNGFIMCESANEEMSPADDTGGKTLRISDPSTIFLQSGTTNICDASVQTEPPVLTDVLSAFSKLTYDETSCKSLLDQLEATGILFACIKCHGYFADEDQVKQHKLRCFSKNTSSSNSISDDAHEPNAAGGVQIKWTQITESGTWNIASDECETEEVQNDARTTCTASQMMNSGQESNSINVHCSRVIDKV